MLRQALLVVASVLGAGVARAQTVSLDETAEQARQAWLGHDATALVASSPRVILELPGADPAMALGAQQAAALLQDFLAGGQEVQVEVRAAREIEPGRGYVELRRRYRVAGTQEVRTQSLLLGYRLSRDGWALAEVQVAGTE